jgi:hypothetical protein
VHVVASVPLYPPGSRVGAWLTTHQYLRALVGRGARVSVCTYLKSDPGYALDGVDVYPREALRELAKQADVIVHHAGDRGEATSFAERHGVPRVCVVHGAISERSAPASADLVVCNSENSRAALGPVPAPVVVCPPPPTPPPGVAPPGERYKACLL